MTEARGRDADMANSDKDAVQAMLGTATGRLKTRTRKRGCSGHGQQLMTAMQIQAML